MMDKVKIINKVSTILFLGLMGMLFMQLGASLFAITMVVSTLTEAPPESLAMLQGDYPYNGSAFWGVWPNIVGGFFLVTLIVNWKNSFKKWILGSLLFYIISAVFAIFVFEPAQADFLSSGLPEAGMLYHRYDWILFSITVLSAITLFIPIFRQLEVFRSSKK